MAIIARENIPYPALAERIFPVKLDQELIPFLGAGVSASGRPDIPEREESVRYPPLAELEDLATKLELTGAARVFFSAAALLSCHLQARQGELGDESASDLFHRLVEAEYRRPRSWRCCSPATNYSSLERSRPSHHQERPAGAGVARARPARRADDGDHADRRGLAARRAEHDRGLLRAVARPRRSVEQAPGHLRKEDPADHDAHAPGQGRRTAREEGAGGAAGRARTRSVGRQRTAALPHPHDQLRPADGEGARGARRAVRRALEQARHDGTSAPDVRDRRPVFRRVQTTRSPWRIRRRRAAASALSKEVTPRVILYKIHGCLDKSVQSPTKAWSFPTTTTSASSRRRKRCRRPSRF